MHSNPNTKYPENLVIHVSATHSNQEMERTIEFPSKGAYTPTCCIAREPLLGGSVRIEYFGADIPKPWVLPLSIGLFQTETPQGITLHGTDARGKELRLLIEQRPDIKALLPVASAISKAISQARTEMWAEMKAPEEARDALLLEALAKEVESLLAQIPAGCIRIIWDDPNPNAADGWGDGGFFIGGRRVPGFAYRFQRVGEPVPEGDRPLIICLGDPCAIRPGALNCFESDRVAYCTAEDLARLKSGMQTEKEKSEKQAAENAANEEIRLNADVPAGAVEAYRRYRGNPEKAWEDGDEGSWADIREYGDAIEHQGLCRAESLSVALAQAREALREESTDAE